MGRRVRAVLHQERMISNAATAAAAADTANLELQAKAAAASVQLEASLASFNAAEAQKKGGLLGVLQNLGEKTKNSLLNPAVAIKDVGDKARAGLSGDVDKRALLRQHHEELIHPLQSTAQTSMTATQLLSSNNPDEVQQGLELRAIADGQAFRNAKTGAAVGIAFVAASALTSVSAPAAEAGSTAAGTSGGFSIGGTTGKLVGSAGIDALRQQRAKTEEATGGLADTSNANGDGMDPATRAHFNDYISNAAQNFFKTGGAATAGTGAAATSCASLGNGDPTLFVIGCVLLGVALVWRVYDHVYH
jgi:hypothetical protein